MERFWKILGIEKTEDEELVKSAYRKKLVNVNPEDDPEGFKELRKSYEDAITYIQELKKEKTFKEFDDLDDIGKWMRKIEEIYFDFPDRITIDKWKELLDDDICVSLDTVGIIEEKLLAFFMDKYYLPHEVWKLIDEQFGIVEDKEKLYEKFPKNFIDFVCNSIIYEDFLDFYLFEGPELGEYDDYIKQYFKVKDMLDYNELEGIEKEIEIMKSNIIYHPYEDVEVVRHYLKLGNNKHAEQIIMELGNKYPNCDYIILYVGEVSFQIGEISRAKEYYEKLLEKFPNHYSAKLGLGKCFLVEKEYLKAKEWFLDMLYVFSGDQNALNEMMRANEYLIESYKKQLDENPNDFETLIELGWCLYQNYRFDDTIDILKDVEIPEDKKPLYNNLMGRTYLSVNNYEKAYPLLLAWVDDLEKIEDDGSEETAKKLTNFGYSYYTIAMTLSNLKEQSEENLKEVLNYLEKAIQNEKDESNKLLYMNYKAQTFLRYEYNEECIDICDEIIRRASGYYPAYLCRQEAYYNMERYQDVIDDYYNAVNIEPGYYIPYLLAIKTFHLFGKYEDCLDIIKRAEDNGINNEEIKLYKVKALRQTLETIAEVKEEAYKLVLDLKDEHVKNDYKEEFYLDILYTEADVCVAMYEFQDALNAMNEAVKLTQKIEFVFYKGYIHHELEEYNEAINIFTELNKEYPNDEKIIYRLAAAYKEEHNLDEAIKYYVKLLDINPERTEAYSAIASMLEEKAQHSTGGKRRNYYNEALKYRDKLIEIQETGYNYLVRGLTLSRLGRVEECIDNYLKSIELDPTNPYSYNNLGVNYHNLEEYDKALEYYLKSIEYVEEDETYLPFNNIAKTYRILEQYDKAEEYLKKGLERFPNSNVFYESLSKLYPIMGKYDEGIKICEEHMENVEDADINEIIRTKGDFYRLKGDLSKAKYYYEDAICKDKNNIDAYFDLGRFYIYQNKYRKALQYYKKALKYVDKTDYDNLSDIYFRMAMMYKFLGFKKEKYFKKSIEYCIKDIGDEKEYFTDTGYMPARLYNITRSYINMGDIEKTEYYIAEMDKYKKCKDCPYGKCYEKFALMGMLAEAKGEVEEALKYYNILLEYEPDYVYAHVAIKRLASEK
ncbi:tetratricopeptide repeat protein [Tissierella praeacuta]|uniref:tetratricopeptide repeat protein n=1 Tax=Tissierella praeacuta TaxID=43131 RepID=UPI003340BAEF